MSSNVHKNSSREELLFRKRKDRNGRSKTPFPVWSRIHRVVQNRPRFQGLDYSGLPRYSHEQIGFQREAKDMIFSIVIASVIILISLYLTS